MTSFKVVVNTVGGFWPIGVFFAGYVTVRFFLFLVDKLRQKHAFKHANKKKTCEDYYTVQVTCKTVAFRFFQTHCEVRVPWHRARSRVSCTPTEP